MENEENKISFKSNKMDELRNNFNLFHPSPSQMHILYDLAEKLALKIDLDKIPLRNILIQSLINWQKKNEYFHFEAESFQPSFKAANTYKIIDEIILVFQPLLSASSGTNDMLRQILNDVFEYYLKTYVTRP